MKMETFMYLVLRVLPIFPRLPALRIPPLVEVIQPILNFSRFQNGTDMFVCSISANGAQLIGSTYFGGSNNEGFNDSLRFNYGDGFRGEIEVQRDGGPVYLAATADSTDYPITPGATEHQGGLTVYLRYCHETWVLSYTVPI